MRSTTVIWEPPCTDEQSALCKAKLDELDAQGIEINPPALTKEGTRDVASRSWSDLATAESWCEFVLSIGAASATVDPE